MEPMEESKLFQRTKVNKNCRPVAIAETIFIKSTLSLGMNAMAATPIMGNQINQLKIL